MKRKILQLILIGALCACTLFCLGVSVLSLIPVETPVEIRERITSSSALLSSEDSAYAITVTGAIRNNLERDVTIERLEIPTETARGNEGPVVVIENVKIPAKGTVTVSKTVTSDRICDYVGKIHATVAGETSYLRNPAEQAATVYLIPLFLTLIFGYLAYRAICVYGYMRKEPEAELTEVQS